jgi:hypothetical protein
VIVPPGVSVCPPMIYVVPDTAVKVFEPSVSKGALVTMGRFPGASKVVWPFTMIAVAPAAREIVLPPIVMTPPGVRIIDPT